MIREQAAAGIEGKVAFIKQPIYNIRGPSKVARHVPSSITAPAYAETPQMVIPDDDGDPKPLNNASL